MEGLHRELDMHSTRLLMIVDVMACQANIELTKSAEKKKKKGFRLIEEHLTTNVKKWSWRKDPPDTAYPCQKWIFEATWWLFQLSPESIFDRDKSRSDRSGKGTMGRLLILAYQSDLPSIIGVGP